MKGLIFILCIMSFNVNSTEFDVNKYLSNTYINVGVGYKFRESKLHYTRNGISNTMNDPYSARIEIGYRYNKHITYGISHHSQWMSGFPFNNTPEYGKTELFIDYTFTLNEIF